MENSFLEIISQSNLLKNKKSQNTINIKFFTNSIINPVDKILKYQLEKKNIKTFIDYYDFDNLNFTNKKKDKNHIAVILWEIENIFPNKFLELEFKNQVETLDNLFEIDNSWMKNINNINNNGYLGRKKNQIESHSIMDRIFSIPIQTNKKYPNNLN